MIEIRPETVDDIERIDEINRLAFEGEEESGLVRAIRNDPEFIPQLSLVAVKNDRVVGHILFSAVKIMTSDGEVPALALAPMAVDPEYQNQGVGSELVRSGLMACSQLGHKIIIVIGHPDYYPRFGFKPAREFGLEVPFDAPDEAFLVLGLEPGVLNNVSGVVRYSSPFSSSLD